MTARNGSAEWRGDVKSGSGTVTVGNGVFEGPYSYESRFGEKEGTNPMGTLHGGVLCDLADAALGMAFVTTMAPEESFTTMALNIHFFRPVWQALLRAEARVVNRGKNVGYVQCDVTDQDRKQIAKATSTYFVLRGEHAIAR